MKNLNLLLVRKTKKSDEKSAEKQSEKMSLDKVYKDTSASEGRVHTKENILTFHYEA